MARRSRGKRVFILGGGASLGAHQVGVIKYLEEQGIRPDAIVGSSIGVINACLYASGGPELMERAWSAFRTGVKVFRPSLRHNPVAGLSLFSMDPLAEAVEEHLDFAKIHASPLELSFILLNLSRGEGQFVSNQGARSPAELRKFARAGYAMPPIFPPYLARLTDVMWRTLGNVGYVTTRIESDGTYRGVPVTVIHPTEELAGFSVANLLRASPRRNRQLITAGYRDAKRELARRARARKRAAEPSSTPVEVAPAYRHEVA
jgi:hypothetical protein